MAAEAAGLPWKLFEEVLIVTDAIYLMCENQTSFYRTFDTDFRSCSAVWRP